MVVTSKKIRVPITSDGRILFNAPRVGADPEPDANLSPLELEVKDAYIAGQDLEQLRASLLSSRRYSADDVNLVVNRFVNLKATNEGKSFDINKPGDNNRFNAFKTKDGKTIVEVSIDGTDVSMISKPASAPAPAPADECEFKATSLRLKRDVQIINTTPKIVGIESDVCGNTVSYTEEMTRTITAGPWTPSDPAEMDQVSAYGKFVNKDGKIYLDRVPTSDEDALLQVSGRTKTPFSVDGVPTKLYGPNGGMPLVGRRIPSSNANKQFGLHKLGQFKGA